MASTVSCSRGISSPSSTSSLFSNLHRRTTRSTSSSSSLQQQIRLQSTTRRATKRLRATPASSAPKPHASAATHIAHSSTPGRAATPAPATSISFDPPSSAPTPFHTPAIFLPVGDPRRKLYEGTAYMARYNPYAADPARPLPAWSKAQRGGQQEPQQPSYHLTAEDVKQMRELRAQDPTYWTRARLAEKFQCSELFVAIGAPGNKQQSDDWWKKQRKQKDQLGPKALKARADREKRRELWYQDA